MAFEPTLAFINTVVAAGVAEGFLPDISISARRQRSQVLLLGKADCERVREIERRSLADTPRVQTRRSEQTRHRIRHAELLRSAGMEPYPLGVRCDYSVEELTNILHSGNISVEEFTLSGRCGLFAIMAGSSSSPS